MVDSGYSLILAELLTSKAEQFPDLNIVTFEGAGIRADETRSYGELLENGYRLAKGLTDRGMQSGDRFALLMRNHPEFIEAMVAASITGCIFVPIDPRTRGAKLAYTLNNANCKGVICADYSHAQVHELREANQLSELKWVLVLGSDEDEPRLGAEGIQGADPVSWLLSESIPDVAFGTSSPDQPFQIMYTSGTTGDPKGVVMAARRYVEAANMGLLFGWDEDERPYTGLSLTHGNAQFITLANALVWSKPCVISRRFSKSRLWDITRQYGCTTFNLLGGMTTAIYSEPEKENDADNPVRRVISSGMPAAIWSDFERRFDIQLIEAYGAIEGGLAFKPIGEGPIGSFGKPPPNLEMKIVSPDGEECRPGEMGELISRPLQGEAPSVEYFKNEKASKEKTAGGWLHSGDICHRNEEGWYFFDYRKGGGIRHNGDFINTGYVEKALAEDPQVTDVFVYGVESASGAPGEKDVVAAIVPLDRESLNISEVFERCRHSLEPNFVPAYLQVVSEIPKTASEKPQERFLLEQFSPTASNIFKG